MKLPIDDTMTIKSLQSAFSNAFPFLRIEFFSRAHVKGKGSEKRDMIDSRKLLGDCRTQHNKGEFFITREMTVSEVETMLENSYGLHVQIFRKSGKLWLETTATDNWTLENQNEQGRELQNANLGTRSDESDYHEQE